MSSSSTPSDLTLSLFQGNMRQADLYVYLSKTSFPNSYEFISFFLSSLPRTVVLKQKKAIDLSEWQKENKSLSKKKKPSLCVVVSTKDEVDEEKKKLEKKQEESSSTTIAYKVHLLSTFWEKELGKKQKELFCKISRFDSLEECVNYYEQVLNGKEWVLYSIQKKQIKEKKGEEKEEEDHEEEDEEEESKKKKKKQKEKKKKHQDKKKETSETETDSSSESDSDSTKRKDVHVSSSSYYPFQSMIVRFPNDPQYHELNQEIQIQTWKQERVQAKIKKLQEKSLLRFASQIQARPVYNSKSKEDIMKYISIQAKEPTQNPKVFSWKYFYQHSAGNMMAQFEIQFMNKGLE